LALPWKNKGINGKGKKGSGERGVPATFQDRFGALQWRERQWKFPVAKETGPIKGVDQKPNI